MLGAMASVPGISEDMPMRAFWDVHAQWTFDVLKNSGVPKEVVLSAAMHHVLGGASSTPTDLGVPIVNVEQGRFQALGVNRELDLRDIMVILLDQYDSNSTRADTDRTHEGAMRWIRSYLEHNPVLTRFPERVRALFARGVDALDRARPLERVQRDAVALSMEISAEESARELPLAS